MGLCGRAVIVGRARLGRRLELVEHSIEVDAVEDQARTLPHGREVWPPVLVEGAALNADVLHGLGVREAALHDFALANLKARMNGLAAQLSAPLIWDQSDA